MELKNQPEVKPEFNLLKVIAISAIVITVLTGLFFLIANLLPSKKSAAAGSPSVYNISGSVLSSANVAIYNQCLTGDTIKITQGLSVDKNCDYLNNKDVVIVVNACNMNWTGNWDFTVGTGSKLFLLNGGQLTASSGNCNASTALVFGSSRMVSCNGSSANFSFAQVNSYGGISYSGLTVLPVKLISFDAKFENGIVKLYWVTATEINNSHFEIQRSVNKTEWDTVGVVKGNGNSSTIIKYSFDDKIGELSGEIYYRLKQVDFDGKSELSDERMVSLNNTKVNKGKVYPNPANDIVKVNINTEADYTIIIQDMSGKEMLRQQGSSSIETLNVAEIPAGIYFVKIQNDVINESHRIVIRH